MMTSNLLFIAFYALMISIGKVGIFKHSRKKRYTKEILQLEDITVIIPFRNEELRISPLLSSINQSNELPSHFIFVDDHSTDASHSRILEELKIDNYSIVQGQESGKKQALSLGISQANTRFVLTMDADVNFSENYFSSLKTLEPLEMQILPVEMISSTWRKLFALDVYLVNVLNTIANGFSRPIAASGANLLFSKDAYQQLNSLTSHVHIASGDDQFLLQHFNQAKVRIGLQDEATYALKTAAPNSISELVQQRVRWIQKTPKVKDEIATTLALIQLTSTLFFTTVLIANLILENYSGFTLVLCSKIALDTLLSWNYLKRMRQLQTFLLLPIYTVLFPFYTLIIAVLTLFYRPKWKGRSI